MKTKKWLGSSGVSVNSIVIPLAVILGILHILIVILVFEVNDYSTELAELMQRSGAYQQDATSLQADVIVLHETAGNYIQMPTGEGGSTNFGPLITFAGELGSERRASKVAERFHQYEVSAAIRSWIDSAAETAERMLEIQLRAVALVRSVCPLPEIPALSAIPDVPLTEEELAMPEEARLALAKRMILDQSYAQMRHRVAENIENCTRSLQEDFSRAVGEAAHHVAVLRTALWIVIAAIIVIFAGIFIMFYRWLIMPLRRYARQIIVDQSIEQMSVVRELRLLVRAYNSLRSRRNKLESILRSAAETDALTGLPNRYCLERFILETGEDGEPMTVLVFDVNYLKRVNDTEGHLAGDKLIRTAASCIQECFSTDLPGNCYRIGGDEFAAVLRTDSEAELKSRIDRFKLALEREKISVSVGYAVGRMTHDGSFKRLMSDADKSMYDQKKRIHDTVCA